MIPVKLLLDKSMFDYLKEHADSEFEIVLSNEVKHLVNEQAVSAIERYVRDNNLEQKLKDMIRRTLEKDSDLIVESIWRKATNNETSPIYNLRDQIVDEARKKLANYFDKISDEKTMDKLIEEATVKLVRESVKKAY
jgi:hypothetical protein